jgi:hypothetical protein
MGEPEEMDGEWPGPCDWAGRSGNFSVADLNFQGALTTAPTSMT